MTTARSLIRALVLATGVGMVACSGPSAQQVRDGGTFAARIARLSEPGGYFDTDNLVSNEASYLHVIGSLRQLEVRGGAYIGVGPDQNFSYIAAIRPNIAMIVDIRRDNMLLHLLFKALFEIAPTRIEYLSLLFGRPAPAEPAAWGDADVEQVVAYVDSLPPTAVLRARAATDSAIVTFGVPLTDGERATIDRFHRAFIRAGPSLRFHTTGRTPRFYYPSYRELLFERDLDGARASYVASEESYRFVRSLQQRDLIIPVVGDLAGTHAMRAIARFVAQRGERVSALYVSNVDFYLFRNGSFPNFVANVKALPRDGGSVIVRSVFRGPFGAAHPHAVPGYYSTQLLQAMESLVQRVETDGYASYWDLVTSDVLGAPAPARP